MGRSTSVKSCDGCTWDFARASKSWVESSVPFQIKYVRNVIVRMQSTHSVPNFFSFLLRFKPHQNSCVGVKDYKLGRTTRKAN